MKSFKIIGIGFLVFAALIIEVQLFISWFLPYMDVTGIGLIYFVGWACRAAIYLGIIVGYDYLWDKYITNNTMAYRRGLIKLYDDQQKGETNFMYAVLKKAKLELQAGKNPTDVENWVVEMEKQFRSKL